ncbi:MAG: FHA domain-containing protein [Acidimicrobiales bacterium]|jgi:pSer/pThr/pTyr-binding forkhead associated (FHA) protein|nr:FHA domain-containing protein [Acidimicrobiales bacterium]
MAEYWLQVSEPGHAKRVVTVDSRMEVGRDCHGILLEDPTVSRRHLTLEPTPAGLVLVDLGSANGTIVDGRRVEGPVALHAGDVIRLGETELVVYEGHATSSATDGEALAIDPHDRVSEQVRNLRAR